MATTSSFASPLGPLHNAHPSCAPAHTLLGLLRTSDAPRAPSSRAAKRAKKDLGRISSPVLQSTTNVAVAAPAYIAAFSTPRVFRPRADGMPSSPASRESTTSSSSCERAGSPPPPPPYRSSPLLDVGDDEDGGVLGDPLPLAAVTALRERTLVDAEQVERRMQQWDAEQRLCMADKAVAVDGLMDDELQRLGL
ncbi:hypothetical protein JCM3770_004668 [Rhodotorula araucariae]